MTKQKKSKKTEKDFEKEIEKQIEVEIEKKIEKKIEAKVGGGSELIGNVVTIIVDLVLIWAVHNVTSWDFPLFSFIKDEFNQLLWIVDLSLGVSILSSLIKIFVSDKRMKAGLQIVENGFTLVVMWVMLSAFPFDFCQLISVDWINTGVKVLMVLLMVVVAIATLVEVGKLFGSATCASGSVKEKE